MFQGTLLLTLDDKGRLSVPKRHREAFGVGQKVPIVLTRHPDGCLVLYPEAVWEARRAALMELSYEARHFVRFVLGSAVDVLPDGHARVQIPADLRALVGLDHEVTLIGMGSHCELWDRQRLAAVEAQALERGLSATHFIF